jgi:hypothetical protein
VKMLKLEGQVVNVYKAPDYQPKDGGEKKVGSHKIQLITDVALKNGETKMDLVTLSVSDPDLYAIGQTASVPVGAFVQAGQIQFYGLKI